MKAGTDYRTGFYESIDIDDGKEWKDVMIVWFQGKSAETVDVSIIPSVKN